MHRMKTNRQGLHAPDSLALANQVSAAAFGADAQLIRRRHRHKHSALFNLGPRGMVILGDSENLMQQCLFHTNALYRLSVEKAKLSGRTESVQPEIDKQWDDELRNYLLREAEASVRLQKAEEFLIYHYYVVKEWPIHDVANHFQVNERHVHYAKNVVIEMLRVKLRGGI